MTDVFTTRGATFDDKIIEVSPTEQYHQCVFRDCRFHGYGSAFLECLFVFNDQLDAMEAAHGTFERCRFSNCQADVYGGGYNDSV